MVEHDGRDPILVVSASRLDPIVSESTCDIRVRHRQPCFRIDDGETSGRIYLVRRNDAIARKALGLTKILSGFARHPNRSDLDEGEEHRGAVSTEPRLRVTRNDERGKERPAWCHRRLARGVWCGRLCCLPGRRRDPCPRAIALLGFCGLRTQRG